MNEERVTRAPAWLQALGLVVLGLMGAAIVYTGVIALQNVSRIGV
jgi:hypothetical protein